MSTQRQAIIVFARMSSSRLPGKVLMDFAGRSLLAHIIARAQLLGLPIIVATSTEPEDAAVAEAAEQCGATAFRGSLGNVLQRAVDCAHAHGLDAFARLCADRPYFPLEPMTDGLRQMQSALQAEVALDLVTNHVSENPPAGLSTEIVRVTALERVLSVKSSERHREHLTSGIYDNAKAFVISSIPQDFTSTHGCRFAVDTCVDYQRLVAVARRLPDVGASAEQVASLLNADGVKSA
jgi:spore coat polysaccharide biosynthesis protein SpsF